MSEEVIVSRHAPLTVQTHFSNDEQNVIQEDEENYISPETDEEFWGNMLRSPTLVVYPDSDSEDEAMMMEDAQQISDFQSATVGEEVENSNWQAAWHEGLQSLQEVTQDKMDKLLKQSGEASLHRKLQLSQMWDFINSKLSPPQSPKWEQSVPSKT